MAFTFGFYNSLKGDRKYNAEQMSEIFDGILKDGIIPSQGQLFVVKSAENGMQITVGTGRAWFDHTWSKNDSVMVLNVPQSDITRPRYDAVVLEVNHEPMVRANEIKIVQGESAVNPVKPTLVNTDKIKQYPLAYILVKAGTEEIKAENIENMVGRTPTVFATGVLETVAIDDLWSQWAGEWHTWFEGIKLQLSGDIVTNLQYQIDSLQTQVKELANMIDVQFITHTEVITTSGTWTNNTGKNIDANVLCFGGGGGYRSNGGAGGGGYMSRGSFNIQKGSSIPITIGSAGTNGTSPTNGGITSFGAYLSATGGSAGLISGDGGSGGAGGGGRGTSSNSNSYAVGKGGNGAYGGGGGGGGGGGHSVSQSSTTQFDGQPGGKGGNGGTYGGGGGGGGGGAPNISNTHQKDVSGANGGLGGSAGANGGAGGVGGASGDINSGGGVVNGTNGSTGGMGISTLNLDVEFKGSGSAGLGGKSGTYSWYGSVWYLGCSGGGGGGGGGYGGNGGNGGNGEDSYYNTLSSGTFASGVGGGGGGGGGYGAKGGNSISYKMHTNSTIPEAAISGGGGGGYGGKGGDAAGINPGFGGGYGMNNYGRGGGSDGTKQDSSYDTLIPNILQPNPGCIILSYTTKEIIIN